MFVMMRSDSYMGSSKKRYSPQEAYYSGVGRIESVTGLGFRYKGELVITCGL